MYLVFIMMLFDSVVWDLIKKKMTVLPLFHMCYPNGAR